MSNQEKIGGLISRMLESASDYEKKGSTGSIMVRVNFNKGGITSINKTEEMTLSN